MRWYFATRHLVPVIVSAVIIQAGLLLLQRPLVVYQESGVVTFLPGTPLQILPVATLSLALSGRTEQFEFCGVRSLASLRLMNAGLLSAIGVATASSMSLAASVTDGIAVSVGNAAPIRAFLGLFGIALGVTAFIDMRLGALCATPLVVLPTAVDLRSTPLGSVVGFVLADGSDGVSWWAAGGLLVFGLIAYTIRYSERSSPSPNRRSIADARLSRRARVEGGR